MNHRVTIDAFALTPEVAQVLKEVRDDRAFAKSRFTVMAGGLAASVAQYADKPSPQLVIVEEEDEDSVMLERLGQLAEVCEPGTRVVVIGRLNDIRLYRTLIGHGVSEYLLRPVTARQVVETLDTLFADPQAAPRGRSIAFWGARGGVGSSTLAANTAYSLAQSLKDDVILIDFDLAFGTTVLSLNLDTKQTIADALANPDRLDAVLLERFMLAYDDHLRVLASAANMASVKVTPEAVARVLELAQAMGAVVIADLPRQWADWSVEIMTAADELVVVSTPDLAGLRDTKAVLDAIGPKRGTAHAPRLLLNKLDAYRRTQIAPKDFEETLGVEALVTLAFEPQLFGDAANNGQMLAETQRTHKVVEQLTSAALTLAGKTNAAARPAKKAAPAADIKALKETVLGWLRK